MSETVLVGCKLPHGLKLRLFKMVEVSEPVLGGGTRKALQAQDTGQCVTLNGWSHPQNRGPNHPIVEGAALTEVDKKFWDAWYADNKDTPFIKQGLIFAQGSLNAFQGEAKEKAKVRSGLERLDPEKMPKGLQKADSL